MQQAGCGVRREGSVLANRHLRRLLQERGCLRTALHHRVEGNPDSRVLLDDAFDLGLARAGLHQLVGLPLGVDALVESGQVRIACSRVIARQRLAWDTAGLAVQRFRISSSQPGVAIFLNLSKLLQSRFGTTDIGRGLGRVLDTLGTKRTKQYADTSNHIFLKDGSSAVRFQVGASLPGDLHATSHCLAYQSFTRRQNTKSLQSLARRTANRLANSTCSLVTGDRDFTPG